MLVMAVMDTVLFQREKTSGSLLGYVVLFSKYQSHTSCRLWHCVRLVQEGMWPRVGVAITLHEKGKSIQLKGDVRV